ncbi:MAG: acyl--CoA ligase [Alphaproteobacteria bacterium]|nr:acyl--CoA ligase [Alphaproteobacteria bacterium]
MALTWDEAVARVSGPGSPFEIVEDERGNRSFRHAPPNLKSLFDLARLGGDEIFLVYEDERWSFNDVFARIDALGDALVNRYGINKGDRVAVGMRNYPEWVMSMLAIISVGGVSVSLNAFWVEDELDYALEDCGATLLIADVERIGRSLNPCRRLGVRMLEVRAASPSAPDVDQWNDVVVPGPELPVVEIGPDDDATILYTSGTTGRPKGALGTHRNMTSNIIAAGFSAARNFLRKGEPIPVVANPMDAPQRATLLSVPFFHATGCFAVLGPTVVSGGKIVLMRKFDAEKAMQLIEKEKINGAGGVPTIAWQILEHPNRHKYDLSSLESMAYGGAPSAPELVRQIKEVWPKSAPGNGWGMTETSATCTTHSGEDYENRPSSCGPAVGACEIKIMDLEGKKELPRGEVGELWARGPNIVKGYWNKPEATAKSFVDGWVITGDLARIDEEGFCFIIDRAKDMLIRGGENIYCIEVENVLYDHPAVMDAALVAVPHKQLGEEPGAVVHLKPGMHTTEEELRQFVAGRLAAFKVPVKVVFWPETLPRNANGKILKTELKKIFAE